jgi:hypothetical protein
MKQVRIKCVDCSRSVIVSVLQPCYYCGRIYKETEIDGLLGQNKAEPVEIDQLLAASGPAPVEPISPASPPWVKLLYAGAILFFVVFCLVCALLIVRYVL